MNTTAQLRPPGSISICVICLVKRLVKAWIRPDQVFKSIKLLGQQIWEIYDICEYETISFQSGFSLCVSCFYRCHLHQTRQDSSTHLEPGFKPFRGSIYACVQTHTWPGTQTLSYSLLLSVARCHGNRPFQTGCSLTSVTWRCCTLKAGQDHFRAWNYLHTWEFGWFNVELICGKRALHVLWFLSMQQFLEAV